MKSERILDAIGLIDERLPDEALKDEAAVQRHIRRKYLAMAACVCLVSAAVFLFSGGDRGERWFPVEKLELGFLFDTPVSSLATSCVQPGWDDLPLVDQYPSIDNDWTRTGAVLPAELVGEYRETRTLTGYDNYDPAAEHTIRADLFAVEGFSPACVLAVRYEGTEEYYCFVSHSYRPETLGQLWQDLSLNEQARFSTAHYDYQKVYGLRANVTLTGVTGELVWEKLIAPCLDAANVHDDTMWLQLPAADEVSLRMDVPLLGIQNLGLQVREDGYVITNLLATGKTFFIGPEAAQTFIAGLKNDLEGSEVLYPYQESTPTDPEEGEWGAASSVPAAQ